jgi:hypothetical protein
MAGEKNQKPKTKKKKKKHKKTPNLTIRRYIYRFVPFKLQVAVHTVRLPRRLWKVVQRAGRSNTLGADSAAKEERRKCQPRICMPKHLLVKTLIKRHALYSWGDNLDMETTSRTATSANHHRVPPCSKQKANKKTALHACGTNLMPSQPSWPQPQPAAA